MKAAVEQLRRFRLDVSGLRQRPLGQQRAGDLIDQDREQDDAADQRAVARQRGGRDAHPQGHAGLRKKRDAQIF